MSRKTADRRGRFVRRMVIGGVIGAGVVVGLSQSASAAVTAQFSASSGVLSVFGDGLDNDIQISRTPAGVILINGRAVPVSGGTATVANVGLIKVFGQRGNDTIALNEANGALPRTNLLGGVGNDTLSGSNGVDLLSGGVGNDFVDGQQGNDVGFLGAGDDVFQWDPGDGSDVVEDRPAPTACCSTAAAPPRSSRRPPTAAGCASPATSAPSSWTSTTSKRST